jgi:hypothetical protein
MSKFNKLAQLNKIANDCIVDGDFVLESKFHQEFMKIAQNERDDSGAILRSNVAKGMGLTPDVSDAELLANVIRVCDYVKPERLRNPNQPASPNNVLLRSMGGATPENSYADEYWQNCQNSFMALVNPNVAKNMKNFCMEIRQSARVGDINSVLKMLASGS